MKKTLATAITLFSLATTVTFAQGVYSKPFDNHRPGQPQAQAPRYTNNDQFQGDIQIDQIDALVGLSRKQEKDLRKIENTYNRLIANPRQPMNVSNELQARKRQEMLSVLTPAQRDRLYSFQSQPNNRFNKNQPSAPYGRRG